MKIMIINPNSTAAMTEDMYETARLVAAPGTIVKAVTSVNGPVSIESYYEKIAAVLGIMEEIKKAGDEYDAFVIACFGDPGLEAAREVTECPVIGIAQASMQMASLVAPKFSVISLIPRTVIPVENLVTRYGMRNYLASIRATSLTALDYEREPDKGMVALLRESKLAIEEDGAEAIILGCAGMTEYAKGVEKELSAPVLDGVTAAVKMAEGLVSLGIETSKINTYDWPPKK